MKGFFLIFLSCSFCFSMQWTEPSYLSGANASGPSLSICPSTGKAGVCWRLETDSIGSIQASIFNGTSWSVPVTLSDEAYDCTLPIIQINSLGHIFVIWKKQLTETTSSIEVSFFNGTSWSEPARLSSSLAVASPDISIDPTGDLAIAVWRNSNGIGVLETSLYDGSSWSGVDDFSPNANVSKNKISMNTNQRAITYWTTPNITKTLQLSLYNEGWSEPISISNANTSVLQVNVAMDPTSGYAAALWSDLNNIQASIWNGVGWNNATTLRSGSLLLVEPGISFHPTNHYLSFIWRGNQGVQAVIHNTSSYSDVISLDTAGINPSSCFNPANGKVGAVWAKNHQIQFVEFDADGAPDPTPLSDEVLTASFPQMGIDANGNAIAIWQIIDEEGAMKIQMSRGSSDE